MLNLSFIEELEKRRKEVLEFLDGRVLIVASSYDKVRNNDVYYPFRQDSQFQYLTGFPEADSVAVFDAEDESENYTLFVRSKDKFQELWTGFRYGVDRAKEVFKADAVYPLEKLEDVLVKKLFERKVVLWVEEGHLCQESLDLLTEEQCSEADEIELQEKLSYMRCLKSPWEIAKMRQAAAISSEAHHALMRRTLTAENEGNLHAEFLYSCHNSGAASQAYPSIVASGVNATCLHYGANNSSIDRDALILVDAGCEVEGYASDITRTFPANGSFNSVQKACYEMVLKAQSVAMENIKPGSSLEEIHDIAVGSLVDDMIQMKLLDVSADEAIGKALYADFYPHGTGHWLGLDVHDCGPDKFTKFTPGMAFTVEPGFYVQSYNDNAPEEFKGIGIRIEDNIVVTDYGYDNMTVNCVKNVEQVESMVLY